MWGKVSNSCLRKEHDGRDWASNHQSSDLKSNAPTSTPPRPSNSLYVYSLVNFKVTFKYTCAVSCLQFSEPGTSVSGCKNLSQEPCLSAL